MLGPTLQTLFFPMSIAGQTQVTYKEEVGRGWGGSCREEVKRKKQSQWSADFTEDLVEMQRKELYHTSHSKSAQIPSWDASTLKHRDCVSISHPVPLLWTMPLAALLCWEPQWPDCHSVCASGLEVLKSDVAQGQGDPGDAAASAPSGSPRLGEVRGRQRPRCRQPPGCPPSLLPSIPASPDSADQQGCSACLWTRSCKVAQAAATDLYGIPWTSTSVCYTRSPCQPDTPSCWNSLPPQLTFMKLFFPQLLVYSVCNILVCSDSCNADLRSQHHMVLPPDWPLETHQGLASQTGSIKWGWRSP